MKIQNKINNIIYGSVMLAPLVAIVSSCAYSIFNKNAVSDIETDIIYKYDFGNATEVTDLRDERTYTIKLNDESFTLLSANDTFIRLDEIYTENYSSKSLTIAPDSINYVDIIFAQLTPDIRRIRVNFGNTYDDISSMWQINQDSSEWGYFTDIYLVFTTWYDINIDDFTETKDYYEFVQPISTPIQNVYTHGVDNRNTFYYSINKVQSSSFFVWAFDTPYYSVFDSFTSFFGVDNDILPFMLSYWLTCSLVMLGYEVITFMVNFARNLINKFEDKTGGF